MLSIYSQHSNHVHTSDAAVAYDKGTIILAQNTKSIENEIK